jgi:hypothetical protein
MPQKKAKIRHHGNHHDVDLIVDAKTGEISSLSSLNFSNNSLAILKLERKRLSGEFSHTGKNHRLNLKLKSDGTYEGTFSESKESSYEIKLKGNQSEVMKKLLPEEAELKVKSDHHEASLVFKDSQKPSGRIKSKFTKDGKFGLELKDGKLSGTIEHKGKTHNTKIKITPKGWSSEVNLKVKDGTIGLKIEGDKKVKLNKADLNLALNI